jgi:MerR family transcriptional regulator, copper efflux regulator
VDELTVSEAAARTGWSPRMLRYLERAGLVVPRRNRGGYRLYGLLELNQLRSLRELRRRYDVELTDVAFAARLEREPEVRAALTTWLAGAQLTALDWEQRKQERLLAA